MWKLTREKVGKPPMKIANIYIDLIRFTFTIIIKNKKKTQMDWLPINRLTFVKTIASCISGLPFPHFKSLSLKLPYTGGLYGWTGVCCCHNKIFRYSDGGSAKKWHYFVLNDTSNIRTSLEDGHLELVHISLYSFFWLYVRRTLISVTVSKLSVIERVDCVTFHRRSPCKRNMVC